MFSSLYSFFKIYLTGRIIIDNCINLQALKERVINFVSSSQNDSFALETIKVAINAAENGNYGVGAILVNERTNEIIYRGQNKVFSEHRSDLHAEMDLLNTFEKQNRDKSRELLHDLTLYTSLESCPMCLCRIITSGVSKVYHIADDDRGGMVHLYKQLPIVWQEISRNRVFNKADCSKELSELALQVFLATADLDNQLAK
jgi:cytosine deaminase